MKRTTKILVTVITGFLGAGKTTFINGILKSHPDLKFALVENEFGEVGIDTKLIKGVEASHMFELKRGCICCTISDEYEMALAELAEKFPDVDHLLIETTGIADPAPVIRPFFADALLKNLYSYYGTVCLVDAINFENSPEREITIKQLVIADLIQISKSENQSEIQKEDFGKALQKINPFAKIEYIKSDSYRNFTLTTIFKKMRTEFDFVSLTGSHADISGKILCFNEPLNKEKFHEWISYTLDVSKNQIYRTKGMLCFENEPYEHILQGVGGSFEITEGEKFVSDALSEIVFIGKIERLDLNF